jgi:hypothetical protein
VATEIGKRSFVPLLYYALQLFCWVSFSVY